MIEQERTFYVNGVPVTWLEIYDWWQVLRQKDRKKADSLGDPYYNEKTCWKIANLIVGEIEKKIHGKISNNFHTDEECIPQRKSDSEYKVARTEDWIDVDWHDASAVFKKAMEDAERKYKEKKRLEEEKIKKAEYEKWRHEEAIRQAKNRKEEAAKRPPPQPQYVPKVTPWRDILGIMYGIRVTENMIKSYFRKQAMIRHPDRGGTNKAMEELFKARDDAYREIGLPPP